MEFKFKLGEPVFFMQHYTIIEGIIESIKVMQEGVFYSCEYHGISLKEKEIFIDYDACKKELITKLRKMIKDLN